MRAVPNHAAMQALATSSVRCSAALPPGAHAAPARAAPPAWLARRQALCAAAALALVSQPRRASASTPSFTSAAGLEYYDDKVGTGEEAAEGDVVKILYSARTVDADGELGNVFDPYGSAGSSASKAYKVTLGASDTDLALMRGWELSIQGGDSLPPMRVGGRRIVRIPPALAYGSDGHLCKRGVKTACEVPPNTTVQIETVLIGRAY